MPKLPHVTTFFALIVCFSVVSTAIPGVAVARDWVVPEQAPTIQAAMDSSVTGDVVILQPGLYDDCTHLSNGALHIAVLPAGVSVRGSSGNPEDVILDAGFLGRCFEIRNSTDEFSIEDITMRRGRAISPLGKGGAVFSMFSNPVFRNCVFDSNYADFGGGAVSAGYGELTVEDCVFFDNQTDGIGADVQVSNNPATISGSTFQGARGASIHYAVDDLTLENCIIAGGDAAAIDQNSETDPDPTLRCCDIFGNEEDYSEFFIDQLDEDGNISEDPLFCNPLFGDLTLYAVSPCAPDNAGDCGMIGARDVGCGTGASIIVITPDGSGPFPNIQAAINIAATGDTIALADGTFTGEGNRDIDYLGKAITVQGLSGDPDLVIIDCEGSLAENHRAFIFQNDEMVTSVLRDVTIINGNVSDDGGGILCLSSPRIENCIFRQNHAERGGGIFCEQGSPDIVDCEFLGNEGRARAGGIGFYASEARVFDCLITGNWGYMGAAFFLPDSSAVEVTGCTITGNNNSNDRATIGLDGNSSLEISNSIIANGPYHAFGEYDEGSVSISGCDVYGHGSSNYGGPVSGQNGSSGNISADALFCDEEAEDYTLRSDSPCSEYSAPNGAQMGNHPVGCAAPSLFADYSENLPETSWASTGVNLVDWNNDGHLDILVVSDDGANEAYDGDGNWNFIEHTGDLAQWPNAAVGATFGDYDSDGDLDLYLSLNGLPNFLGQNDEGEFNVVPTDSLQRGGPAGASSWGDANGDGHLDLFIAGTDSNSVLMQADGEGDYENITTGDLADTGPCVSATWVDYDNDGDQDLFLVQDGQADKLLKNVDGFTLVEEADLGNAGAGRGAAWGDYDNDGDLDLYVSIHEASNRLLRNDGGDNFAPVQTGPLADSGPSRSGIWGDWDNDGDLDLFLTNCGQPDHLLRNNGGSFSDSGDSIFAAPDSSEGAAFGDIDNDGDLDILLAVRGERTRLLRNNVVNENHWLKLDLHSLHGMVGSLGARVMVVTGADTVQIREVASGGGWRSRDDLMVHFGLGTHTMVDSLVVTWPGGQPLIVKEVEADQVLVLTEEFVEGMVGVPNQLVLKPFGLDAAYPNPFNPVTTIGFAVPESRRVSIKIYDVAGRLVKVLLDEHREAGRHEVQWRGRDGADRTVAAGVYFYRLEAGRFNRTRTMVLVK